VHKEGALLCVHRALLSVHRALLRVHRALLRICGSLLSLSCTLTEGEPECIRKRLF